MIEKAVVDRIEEGLAVLLISDEEREMTTPLNRLPAGLQPGDWLRVEFRRNQLIHAEKDYQDTKHREGRIRQKLQRLLNKPR